MEVIAEDRVIFTLEKVERKSPTLGLKPPQGPRYCSMEQMWTIGSTASWSMASTWEPPVSSKLALKDHTLHIEFRTPFMPTARGQARGNRPITSYRFSIRLV